MAVAAPSPSVPHLTRIIAATVWRYCTYPYSGSQKRAVTLPHSRDFGLRTTDYPDYPDEESLNVFDEILKLLDADADADVGLLRWSEYFGVRPTLNLGWTGV